MEQASGTSQPGLSPIPITHRIAGDAFSRQAGTRQISSSLEATAEIEKESRNGGEVQRERSGKSCLEFPSGYRARSGTSLSVLLTHPGTLLNGFKLPRERTEQKPLHCNASPDSQLASPFLPSS